MSALGMPQSVQDVQKAVETVIDDLQRTVLMPKQKEAFLCCAKCCDAPGGVRELEACVQRCSQPNAEMQRTIQQSLGDFQERFQRAAMRCQDQARESMSFEPTAAERSQGEAKFHSCMEASGREFLQKVPKLKSDLQAALKRI